jgi:poly(3-hydroxybutyrate) depolymerase
MKSWLEEPEAQQLPDAGNLHVNKKHYYQQILHGYYQFDCVVSKDKNIIRSTKFYIPEGSIYNQPTIIIALPENTNPWKFIVDSGWKDLADHYGLYLVMAEPVNDGTWGDIESEAEYLNALDGDLNLRPMFCAFQANFYSIGYGKGADLIGWQSRRMPRSYAAVALLGTSGISVEEEKECQEKDTRVEGVKCADVQWPIWLTYDKATEDSRREVAYYQRADHSNLNGLKEDTRTTFIPQEGGTIDEEWCAPVITDVTDWQSCVNREYSKMILTKLFDGIYRYPGNNNGALRHADNIYERGFKKFHAPVWGGLNEDHSDTYEREWYVYLPESAPKKNIPAVFVFHGAGGSGDEIADRIGWSKAADKYGLLIIMGSASPDNAVREISDIRTNNILRTWWNTAKPYGERPTDMLYLDYMYQWLIKNYDVDRSRIYASGQSSGGGMSWGCAAYRPDYFAAVAPFSAYRMELGAWERGEKDPAPVNTSKIAVFTNLGYCDNAFKGGWTGKDAQDLITTFCEIDHTVQNWHDYTFLDHGKSATYSKGNMHYYVFNTKSGVPILKVSETEQKAHATLPSEVMEAWEYMKDYTKDPESKELYYKGEKVVL